jgi:FkbM family methyltransferase
MSDKNELKLDSLQEFRDSILLDTINGLKFNNYFDNYDSIFTDLTGIDSSTIFDTVERVRNLNWFYGNADKLHSAYRLLCDTYSRNLYKRLICYRLAGFHSFKINPAYLSRTEALETLRANEKCCPSSLDISGFKGALKHYEFCHEGRQYSVDCLGLDYYLYRGQYYYSSENVTIQPESGDFVVDGGACLGDTAAVFSNSVGPGGKVFAFDPVREHLEVLQFNTNQFAYKNVIPVGYALGDRLVDGEPLGIGGYNPGLRSTGSEMPTTTLDHYFSQHKTERLDFIKLDVEGAELQALIGGRNIIERFMPKLAISLYHKPNDLHEIILFIKSAFPFYQQYFIDHYTIHQGETVLYVRN